MQERLAFSAHRARFTKFTRSAFGGRLRHLKSAAAIALAAVFISPAPAAGIFPANASVIAPVRQGPALWVVQDTDTTIYLFGTFHALDSNAGWFDPSIRAAFDASDELVLETLIPEDPAELHAIVARHSLAKEPQVGQPVYSDRGGSSFVASAGQAMSAGKDIGISVDHGADAVLRRAANAGGKAVEGLESFEFQLRMFGSLPPPPKASRQGAHTLPGFIGNMQSAWKRGDNAGFASLLGTIRAQSPQTYRTLFVDRNVHWADWIAERMARPGTVFVAVGTGHLVGPGSLQAQLSTRGITSARIS